MTLTLELSPDREAALRSVAEAQGITTERWLQSVVEERLSSMAPNYQPTESTSLRPTSDRPIWEVILDEMKDVPAEAFASLPTDGASQIDHYIYGTPKRDM